MRTNPFGRGRRVVAAASTAALLAGSLIASAAPTLNAYAASPQVASEFDCQATTAIGVQDIPVIGATVGVTVTPAPSYPAGTVTAAGDAAGVLVGAAVAEFVAAGSTTLDITNFTATIGSTDGTGGGTIPISVADMGAQPVNGTKFSGSTTAGSTTVNITAGTPSAADVGRVFAESPLDGAPTSGIPLNDVITAETATTLTLAAPAANTFTGTYGSGGNMVFVTPFSGNLTASATNGGTANFGMTALGGGGVLTSNLGTAVNFGATATVYNNPPGTTASPGACILTGYTAANAQGPVLGSYGAASGGPFIAAETTPIIPLAAYQAEVTAGALSPLVSAGPPAVGPVGFSVGSTIAAPVTGTSAANAGENGTTNIILTASQPATQPSNTPAQTFTYAATAGTCANAATESVVVTGNSAAFTNGSTSATTCTFTYTATNSPGNVASAPQTVTVTVGTPPVDQPIGITITGGQLVLSCQDPLVNTTPLLTCPLVTLPGITLNGTTQTTPVTALNPTYVSDNRGQPVAWTESASFVATTAANGQSNATCAGIVAFCNSAGTANGALANNQIQPANLALSAVTCAAEAGNLNAAPTAGAGGTFAATQTLCSAAAGANSGSFKETGSVALTVPSSTYAGTYYGTVEYTVA